ncbi:MAG: hypothetical protein AAGA56_21445 [Myxococcota bacterium]
MVVKWGDEVQIPTLDLAGWDPRLGGADVVRFVSVQPLDEENALNKDWVGVSADGKVTAFIPRRPLREMEPLAEQGLLSRRGGRLVGGVNLGSIAVSRGLLDALFDEFSADVLDPAANRKARPDLDPQFFTALTLAAAEDEAMARERWAEARATSPAIAALDRQMPALFSRLRRCLDAYAAQKGGPVELRALDFGDQYWGDMGQHRQFFDFFHALRLASAEGEVARHLAGLGPPDEGGNWIVGDTELGPDVVVEGSVLIDARIGSGRVVDSVLVGTEALRIDARGALDVESTVTELRLAERSAGYKVVCGASLQLGSGERATTVFADEAELVRVHEGTDLRDRVHYDEPWRDNGRAFRELHRRALATDPDQVARARLEAREVVRKSWVE